MIFSQLDPNRTLPTLTPGTTAPQGTAPADQVSTFNSALMSLLKRFQGMGTRQFATQQLDAQALQAQRMTQTPQNLIGAAPGVQNAVRGASVSAVQPTVAGAQQSQQTFGEQLNSFGNAIDSAKSFMDSYQQQQEKARANAQNIVSMALAGGAESVAQLIKNQPDLIKLSGFDVNTLQAIAATQKPKKETQIIEANGRQLLVDSQTGDIIKDLGSAYHPGTGGTDLSKLLTPEEASKFGVPYGTTYGGLIGKNLGGGDTTLKTQALTSAKALLDKFQAGGATSGSLFKSNILSIIPNSKSRDFTTQLGNLKSLLSLDNVKYLKGQGQVSDAERKLLEEASSKLNINLSGPEFKSTLDSIIQALSGTGTGAATATSLPPNVAGPVMPSSTSGQTSSGLKYTIEP